MLLLLVGAEQGGLLAEAEEPEDLQPLLKLFPAGVLTLLLLGREVPAGITAPGMWEILATLLPSIFRPQFHGMEAEEGVCDMTTLTQTPAEMAQLGPAVAVDRLLTILVPLMGALELKGIPVVPVDITFLVGAAEVEVV